MVVGVGSRAACIYSISALSNWLRIRTMNVTTSCQHILVWGGIVRGSVTMAIAYKTLRRGENDAGLEFEDYSDSTSPTMVRLITVLVKGGTI